MGAKGEKNVELEYFELRQITSHQKAEKNKFASALNI